MKIYKHRAFHQWAKSEGLLDSLLKQAVDEIGKGLWEACLGSGLYKKRLALIGHGKRGSYRTLIAFRAEDKAFFIYGFAKNIRSNINETEKKIYRRLAKDLLMMERRCLEELIKKDSLIEVN